MAETKKGIGWREVLRSLAKPKVAIMLGLGFSAGLPFMLVGNTLGFWLRENGITLTAIGFLSWVGLAYSFKFLWSPLVDKARVPILGKRLGLRRSWLLLAQTLIALALIAMAVVQPIGGIALFTGFAALAAFASSTQDIVIDAWRIEVSDNDSEMAMLSSAYQLGYRAALLVTDSLILILAAKIGWSSSYLAMAAAMSIGILATFIAVEPEKVAQFAKTQSNKFSFRKAYDAIAGPFISFFQQHGSKALWMLAAVSLYRFADFFMGPMNNPFYRDVGLTLETVGTVRATVGLTANVIGIAVGGLCAIRLGLPRTLLIGAIIGPGSNLAFAGLATWGVTNESFAVAIAIDNFSSSFAGVALMGYMSSLTSLGYVATQFALLTSFYSLPGKFTKGFSGALVDYLKDGRELMSAYAIFFSITALVGIPALILCFILIRQNRHANT